MTLFLGLSWYSVGVEASFDLTVSILRGDRRLKTGNVMDVVGRTKT